MKRFDFPLLVLLAVSMLGNAFLAYQNIRLREAIPAAPVRDHLALGTSVTSLPLGSMSGSEIQFHFPTADKPLLLYAISSSCKWCASNIEVARALEASVQDKYRFVTLCMDGELEQCRSKAGRGALYVPTPETISILKLGVVPQAIVLTSSGRVDRVWTGVFRNAIKKDMEDYFGGPLQGLDCSSVPSTAGCENAEGSS